VDTEGINFDHLATDHAALFKLYKSDEITAVALSSEMPAQTVESGKRFRLGQIGLVMSVGFNHTFSGLTSNLHLRKAIALIMDRDEIMNKVMGSG
jgi:ABC-type oligopeptide transport system substrate-binding subunit